MSFDDLKLRNKILIPLAAMALVFAGVVAVGVQRLSGLTQGYGQITTHADPAVLRVNRTMRVLSDLGRDIYAIVAYAPTDPRRQAVQADYAKAEATADKALADASALDPAHADTFARFRQRFDTIYDETMAPKAIGDAIPGLADGPKLTPDDLAQVATAAKQLAQIDADIGELSKDMQDFNHTVEARNDETVQALQKQARQTVWLMILLGAAAVTAGLGVSVWIAARKVAAPLAALGQRMERLANGDLQVSIEGQQRRDEVGAMAKAVQVFKANALKNREMEAEAQGLKDAAEAQREAAERERAARAADLARVVKALAAGLQTLADGVLTYRLNDKFAEEYEPLRLDFNAAMAKVQAAVAAVTRSAAGIDSGAGEITEAADSLSRRTEQQAASLEETAAALDEITATVRRTAEGAQTAREAVHRARQEAEASGGVVDGAVKAMDAIERSSREIGQIIGVIDEIAFQTNLLALNAGVEAARAGDAGRGFAVVAQEVRGLAQRSAQAAKEIKLLISASAREVGNGVELVGEAGRALQRITDQVAEITAIVEEISHSTTEQATGLAQVNTAVNQMDQMTQQNAAMVEESTAASHGLAREAKTLAELTRGFKVDGGAAAPAAPAPASRNPVRAAQARLAGFARGGQAAAVQTWEEF